MGVGGCLQAAGSGCLQVPPALPVPPALRPDLVLAARGSFSSAQRRCGFLMQFVNASFTSQLLTRRCRKAPRNALRSRGAPAHGCSPFPSRRRRTAPPCRHSRTSPPRSAPGWAAAGCNPPPPNLSPVPGSGGGAAALRVTETVRFRSCGAPPCLPCSRPARLLGCSRSAAGTREVSAGAPRVILGGRVVGSLLAPAAAASAVCQPPAARSQSRPFRSRGPGGGGGEAGPCGAPARPRGEFLCLPGCGGQRPSWASRSDSRG